MPKRLLPTVPEFAVSSIDEILSLASALERQAASRYELFGRCMRQIGHSELANVFESLCAEEKRHVEGVERLSEQLLSRPPSADVVDWIVPETFTLEEAGAPSQLTVYDVLAIAIRSEERAFSFWTYVAATAKSEPVRIQAEAMARQELVHASRLRQERRAAYHAGLRWPHPSHPGSVEVPNAAAVWREARRLEAEAAGFLAAVAARLLQLEDEESAMLLQTIAENMRLIVPADAARSDSPTDRDLVRRSIDAAAATGPSSLLFEAAGVIDKLVERYAGMISASPDASVTTEIEKFAAPALEHLARINERLYAVEPELRNIAGSDATAE